MTEDDRARLIAKFPPDPLRWPVSFTLTGVALAVAPPTSRFCCSAFNLFSLQIMHAYSSIKQSRHLADSLLSHLVCPASEHNLL